VPPIDCSVVVALNPHENNLALVLDSYVAQTAAEGTFEVIVVSGGARGHVAGSYDEHRARFPATPVRLVTVEASGRAAANNAGARASRSPLLLFVGDDFIPSATLVRAHVDFHKTVVQGAVAGIGPSFFSDALRRDPFRCWIEDSGQLFGVPFRLATGHWPRSFFYAGNASIARALFAQLGGFDEALHDTGDDFEFGIRLGSAGGASHFLPKALAWHDHPLTLPERAMAHWYAGERARHVIALHGDISQWNKFVAQPLADFEDDATKAEERHRADPTAFTLIACYQVLLDLAFAEGFNGVKRTEERSVPRLDGR
jgi:hypothetical protein